MISIKFHYKNAGGFGSKGKRVKSEFSSTERDIICITETWLNNTHLNSEFFPSEFDIHRNDRCDMMNRKGKGGGVMIAIKSHIRNERILIDGSNDINYVCAKISLQRGNIFIYIGYIPPKEKDIVIYRKHIETIKKLT